MKAVSWMDQQQPTTTSVTEAASALLSLATSPPSRSDIDSAAPADAMATPGASDSSARVAIKAARARQKAKASKKKRRSALVRSFDAFVSSTAAAAAVKRSGSAATEAADGGARPSGEPAEEAEPATEAGSRGRSGSVADEGSSSPSPTGSSRGREADTAAPAVAVSTATDAGAATAAADAATAAATSPATQPLEVAVESDAPSPRASVTPTPQVVDEAVARQEVPGEMLLSAVMADVDRVVGRRAGEDTAPISDQTLLTPSARAAYAAVARNEGGADFSREREEASAVSALALSSATEEGGNDEGETLAAGEGAESPPTPAAQKQRRSSLLGRWVG